MSDVIRIGNCSGYYGDRLAAAKEMIDGGPIDVLTGDYLAELTMTILYNQMQTRGENMGYVGTFLKQIKDVASDCKEKNIKSYITFRNSLRFLKANCKSEVSTSGFG